MTEDLKNSRRRSRQPEMADRLPPHAPEAEGGILGCILLDPSTVMPRCLERPLSKDAFYDLRNQSIYEVMEMMADCGEPIDIVTLSQRLKDMSMLEQVGGIQYISSLPDMSPSSANLSFYMDLLEEKWTLRKMLHFCSNTIGKIYDLNGEPVSEFVDESEREMLALSNSRTTTQARTIREIVVEAIRDIEAAHERQGAVTGLTTGFADLDKLTDGMHPKEMIVIAARPSMGKTSLAMNIAEHVALDLNLPVGVFSLEMSDIELVKRVLASRGRVNLRTVSQGIAAERDFPKMTAAAGALVKSNILIDDTGGLTIGQMKARARRWHQEHGIKLLVIDYLQLLKAPSRAKEGRQNEISEISAAIKTTAKDLSIPVIVLSQLNRELEKDKNRKPRLSDLRESGSIEQDADVVGMLYAPDPEDEEESDAIAINLLIAKQRNGERNKDVRLTFLKQYTRFESAAKVADTDLPFPTD